MQSHHKMIKIYADVVQIPTLPWAFPNILDICVNFSYIEFFRHVINFSGSVEVILSHYHKTS